MYKKLFTMLFVVTLMISATSIVQAQSGSGPTNYCIPNASMVPEATQWNQDMWCYPLYLKNMGYDQWYDYYFSIPIKEVKVSNAATDEVALYRKSETTALWGIWEGCYVYTGVKGEIQPGETYDIAYKVDYNYYSYYGTDYCNYGYSWLSYTNRVFIDFNIDGDFDDANEWVNSPTRIANGSTKKNWGNLGLEN